VQDGGFLAATSGTIKMKNLSSINILQNGTISTTGYDGAYSKITGISSSDYYNLTLHSGSFTDAIYTIFENLPEQGMYIAPGAVVSELHAFNNCEFRKGKSGPNVLLTIDNSQDLVIENAVFPDNTWDGQYNVRKSVNSGSVNFVNATGAFAGEDYDDDLYNRINWTTVTTKTLNLKAYLEGLYAGAGLMHKAQDVSGDHFPDNVADQVTVELHDATTPFGIAYTYSSLNLNTDGTLSITTIPGSLTGSFYIVIKHRNSIETWSMAPVSFAGAGTIIYDFSTSASQAYGNNMKLMGTVYAIYSGDPNQDGTVDGSDMLLLDNASQPPVLHGYYPEDLNGDGTVDGTDMLMIDNSSQPPVVQVKKP
jgi:hypothetical protein